MCVYTRFPSILSVGLWYLCALEAYTWPRRRGFAFARDACDECLCVREAVYSKGILWVVMLLYCVYMRVVEFFFTDKDEL